MTDYVVGDIQGCLYELLALLRKVEFNPEHDRLIAAGDIVNRGPKSLETLRFCRSLGASFQMVLGNHDLHLLAIAHGVKKPSSKDTIQDILAASDASTLIDWLQQHPLLLTIGEYTIVHAGIPPQWDIDQAKLFAKEVQSVLLSDRSGEFFKNMYGDTPNIWDPTLPSTDRLRLITNYFTRMRFCTEEGQLDLQNKDSVITDFPYSAWFSWKNRRSAPNKIIFGHWAALKGMNCGHNLFALDTGCVWGGPLRVMDLDNEKFIEYSKPNRQ
jgi:bis(5'-nucleosyl)-tetraphosphatase (symmetrical)